MLLVKAHKGRITTYPNLTANKPKQSKLFFPYCFGSFNNYNPEYIELIIFFWSKKYYIKWKGKDSQLSVMHKLPSEPFIKCCNPVKISNRWRKR